MRFNNTSANLHFSSALRSRHDLPGSEVKLGVSSFAHVEGKERAGRTGTTEQQAAQKQAIQTKGKKRMLCRRTVRQLGTRPPSFVI